MIPENLQVYLLLYLRMFNNSRRLDNKYVCMHVNLLNIQFEMKVCVKNCIFKNAVKIKINIFSKRKWFCVFFFL